jgi:pimeloyl-ACP methyl ester carboxylesterase
MQLHFRKLGEGNPLIILHGLFGQSDNWNTLAKKFAEHSLSVYTVDLRNLGLSPHSDTMSYSEMANDVKELIESENINQPILLGHSMGGKVAMWFDYLFPNILSKIIVVDIAPKKYPPGHTDVFNALNAVDFSAAKTRKDVEMQIRKHLSNEAVIQFLLKNVHWETPEKLNWRFNLSIIENYYEEILSAVPEYSSFTTALFIKGELSNYITNEDIEDIQKRYPDYQLVSIPKAGHWVHAEQPQIFMEEVLKFISI